jgi:hypothetical protein
VLNLEQGDVQGGMIKNHNIKNIVLCWWQIEDTASPMTIWVAKSYYWTTINQTRE